MGIPLALANLLDRSSLWVTSAFIGQHGGAAELGPASLASTVNNVLGTSVNIGLSLAVQTLASQAAGAGDAAALRRSLQRAYPISLLFSLPVMLLLLCLGPLLRLLGRPPEFADAAAAYGLCILPVATLVGAQRAMAVWLAALQITRPVLLINLVLVPLHVLLTCAEPALFTRTAPSPPPPPPPPPPPAPLSRYVLVELSPLGYLGAGVAMSVGSALRAGATYAYIRASPRCAHAWDGFRPREAFSGWASCAPRPGRFEPVDPGPWELSRRCAPLVQRTQRCSEPGTREERPYARGGHRTPSCAATRRTPGHLPQTCGWPCRACSSSRSSGWASSSSSPPRCCRTPPPCSPPLPSTS